MKKILLFLFAIFLTTIKIDASVVKPTNYLIHFKQQTMDYNKVVVGGGKITTSNYEIYEVLNDSERYRAKVSASTNIGFSERSAITYHMIETSYSEGYYENELFDYTFTLDSKCPKIDILIEKKIKEYELKIISKNQKSAYYYLFDGKGNTIKSKTTFENEDTLILVYDSYRIKTLYGDYTFDFKNLNDYENGILFENDSLVIIGSEIKIDTPYKPVITINKTCQEEEPIVVDEQTDKIDKEDQDESTFKNSSENNYSNVSLEDDAIPKIEIDKDIKSEVISEVNILKPEDTNDLPIVNTIKADEIKLESKPVIKKSKTAKKKTVKPVLEINNEIIEEPENNLIIEYSNDSVSDTFSSYHKSSNLPLIITVLTSIFIIFVVKIIKKVQKS